MALLGGFTQISPNDWLFPTHGDVLEGKRRAQEWFDLHGTYDGAEFVIEEFVRQWALKRLLEAYKYPEEWLGERIIIEEPVKMGSTEKEADISIKNANRRTFLYVETKKRGASEDEFKEAERQLETYLSSTHTATIGLITDGDRVRTLRKKIVQYVVDHQGAVITPHDLHEFKFFHLHGIEKSDRMVRIAMTDMMLHDDGHTNIRNQDALLSFDNYPDIIALRDEDGKQATDPSVFDIVLTNPPFGSIMRQETMEMLGRFDLGHKKKSLPLEILGLERSLQFLKPGGRMAIVLPEHLMKGKSAAFVRKWLYGVIRICGIFFFPEEAFTPYGAMVKTCLCVFQKLTKEEEPESDDETFLCEVENLGYEATGKPKAGSEVQAAIEAFRKHEDDE
jgi:N-6 DNA methylase/type I restriction and modification enzyme subunit R-like protein